MPELFTLQIQGALSARNWFVPLGSDTEHSILTAVDHTKGLIFFPNYYTGHSEAASSSVADYDVAHKKLHCTESINAREHSVSGNKAMMHATCGEMTFSIWLHNKRKVMCMQATVMDTDRVSFQKRKAVELKQDTQAGLSWSEYCAHLPHSISGNGNARELYFAKMKAAGQVRSGATAAAGSIRQKMLHFAQCFFTT